MRSRSILIAAIIASALFLVFANLYPSECDGFGCVASGIGFAFVYFVLIPIAFGVLSFVLNKEHRFWRALSSFGISLAVALVLIVVPAFMATRRNQARNATENLFVDPASRKDYSSPPP